MNAFFAEWQPWVEVLGWSLLHFIWQGAVIGAIYAALRWLLPKDSCNLRYALGLAALALLALSPLVTLWVLRPQATVAVMQSLGAIGAADATQTGASIAISGTGVAQVLPWLVLLWILGALAMSWRALRQWRALDRVACRLAEGNAQVDRLMARLGPCFGFWRNVRVLVSNHIDTPTLIGWIKPVILLPASVALGFPSQHLELILAHELGHLRRYDHLVNLAQAILETLLYYHPVVHWISREVRNEREICCDQLVLRVTRGEPREYARTLAALEELRFTERRLAVAATGGVLLERVRRIVGMPAPRLSAKPNAALWVMAVATAIVAFTAAVRIEQNNRVDAGAMISMALDRLPRPDARALAGFSLRLPPMTVSLAAAEPPPIQPIAVAVGIERTTAVQARLLPAAVEMLPAVQRPRIELAASLRDDLKPVAQSLEIAGLRIPLSAPKTALLAMPAAERADDDDSNCVRRTGSRLCRHIVREAPNMTIIYGGGDTVGGSHKTGP